MNNNRVICAIDSPDLNYACELTHSLKGMVAAVKLGLEFFTACGIDGVRKVIGLGIPVFLDLKLHDIPNTVASTVSVLKKLNIFMLTIHVSGGEDMLKAAMKEFSGANVKIVGVTVLTSLSDGDMRKMNVDCTASEQAVRLAKIAKQCGLDGTVCSGHDVARIRKECGENFTLVTPGIRPVSYGQNDHKRSVTPSQAINSGTDYVVIGRPITDSENPIDAVEQILREIKGGGE